MKKLLLAVPVLACVFGGCATPQEPFQPRADHIPIEQYPKITTTYELSRYLVIAQPTVVQDGVLRVIVPVRMTSRPGEWAKVQYRFMFLDARGVPLTVQPDWQPVTLEPQQQVFMSGNAMDSNAADWRLEIRSQR